MFELSYFVGTKHLLPTGWGEVEEDKIYPSLSSRAPQPEQALDDMSNRGAESDDDEQYPSIPFSTNTRMVDEESSDEDELAGPTPIPVVSCNHFLGQKTSFTCELPPTNSNTNFLYLTED